MFEERAGEFSSELEALLEKLYDQGVLEGRTRERFDHLEMMGSKMSECGTYWCTPMNKAMLVLDGARAGAERFEARASQRARARARGNRQPAHPWHELLLEMDAEILEKLASQSLELQRSRGPGAGGVVLEPALGDVLAIVSSSPRVPARQRANVWEQMPADSFMDSAQMWTKQLFNSLGVSQSTLTAGSSTPSATALPPAGKFAKR